MSLPSRDFVTLWRFSRKGACMSQHNYDLAVISVIAACIGRPILLCLWNVARITYCADSDNDAAALGEL
jgi:hypothetical protein